MINPNAPQPVNRPANGRPGPPSLALSTGGLGVNGQPTLKTNGGGSNPISANSSVSTVDIARGLREPGGSDPASAISSFDEEGNDQLEGENGVSALGFDLDRLSLEKGRPLDVEDLDDKGWHAASEQKKIIELGSLGEGAGGAVTRCQLKDGKTVFALKVCFSARYLNPVSSVTDFLSR
jgi:mitogen-activated protein kinase kinase